MDTIDPDVKLFDNLDQLPRHPQPYESQLCGLCGAGQYDGVQQHVPGCLNAPKAEP